MARSTPRSSILLRRLAVAGLVLIAFLYYRPLRTYFETRDTLARREAEVRALEAKRRELERRLAQAASGETLAVQARRIGLVRPGEHLYIVKGIPQWLRAHRATIAGGG